MTLTTDRRAHPCALADAGVTTAFGLPGVHNLPFWRDLDDGRHPPHGDPCHHRPPRADRRLRRRRSRPRHRRARRRARHIGTRSGEHAGRVRRGSRQRRPAARHRQRRPRGHSATATACAACCTSHPTRARGSPHWPRRSCNRGRQTPQSPPRARRSSIAMSHPRGPVYLGVPADVLRADAPGAPTARVAATPDSHLRRRQRGRRPAAARPTSGAVDRRRRRRLRSRRRHAGLATRCAGVRHLRRPRPPAARPPAARRRPRPWNRAPASCWPTTDLLLVLGSALDGMTTAHWSLPRPQPRHRRQRAPQRGPRPRRHRRRGRRCLRRRGRSAAAAAASRGPTPRSGSAAPSALPPPPTRGPARPSASSTRSSAPGLPATRWSATWPSPATGSAGTPPSTARVSCSTRSAGGRSATGCRQRSASRPPGTPTLAVVGDGGLAMATGELATFAQEHLPVTVLVVADGGYGMLRFDQQRAGHAERGVDLDPPEWDALGTAFGLPVDRPADTDDLRDVLARAAVSGDTAPRRLPRHALPAALHVPPLGRSRQVIWLPMARCWASSPALPSRRSLHVCTTRCPGTSGGCRHVGGGAADSAGDPHRGGRRRRRSHADDSPPPSRRWMWPNASWPAHRTSCRPPSPCATWLSASTPSPALTGTPPTRCSPGPTAATPAMTSGRLSGQATRRRRPVRATAARRWCRSASTGRMRVATPHRRQTATTTMCLTGSRRPSQRWRRSGPTRSTCSATARR